MPQKRFSKEKSEKARSTRKNADKFHNTLLLMQIGGKVKAYQLKKTKRNFKRGGFDLNRLNPFHKPTIGEQVQTTVEKVDPLAEPTLYQKTSKAIQNLNPWREPTLMEKYGYKGGDATEPATPSPSPVSAVPTPSPASATSSPVEVTSAPVPAPTPAPVVSAVPSAAVPNAVTKPSP